ncbi:MAG: methylated-DNA--[protein]-cysteine S-methyltransferase [Clostridiales bacterium]|nr:methylated-DNA--[protein]-cysteine S-methyltransferase [Clostridiales bacterium]
MDTPIGWISISEDGKGICGLYFVQPDMLEGQAGWAKSSGEPLLREAASQLQAYFRGNLQRFDLPVSLRGTPFQVDDWHALMTIPYGETRSYKQIAEQIGRPKAFRAVGMANHRNPVSIIIPCHRVIGHHGAMVGYGGGVWRKEYLLAHEGKQAATSRLA